MPSPPLIVIPARLSSSRFPNKALTPILGQPLVRQVVLRVCAAVSTRVVVATDALPIARAVEDLCEVWVAELAVACGSDRVAATYKHLGAQADWVVNVQGDEACLPPAALRSFLAQLDQPSREGTPEDQADVRAPVRAPIVTPCIPMTTPAGFADADVVKVVCGEDGNARYFSRSAIPYGASQWLRHVGLYAFTPTALEAFSAHPVEQLERTESLEQLRAIAAGWPIRVARLEAWRDRPWPSVNRPMDVAAASAYLGAVSSDAPGGASRQQPG